MIRSLDTFRFFAFVAVFLFHVHVLEGGYLGVQAFFVLSGFLLTPILVQMKRDLPKREYFLNFYGRRSLRIFPLYYAYLLIGGLLAGLAMAKLGMENMVGLQRFHSQMIFAATYTYDFFHASDSFAYTPFLTHFWSLAVEEQFYLIWPLCLWLVPHDRVNRLLVGIVVAGPALRLLTWLAARGQWIPGIHDDPNLAVYVLPFSYLDAFAIGGLFALRKRPLAGWAPWACIAAALTLGFGAEWATGNEIRWDTLGFAQFVRGQGKEIWGYSVLNLAFAAVLSSLAAGQFLPTIFGFRPLQYLGKISYGLYVYHVPVIALAKNRLDGHLPPLALDAVMLAGTIAVSVLSYECFEKHCLNLKDRFFPKEHKRA